MIQQCLRRVTRHLHILPLCKGIIGSIRNDWSQSSMVKIANDIRVELLKLIRKTFDQLIVAISMCGVLPLCFRIIQLVKHTTNLFNCPQTLVVPLNSWHNRNVMRMKSKEPAFRVEIGWVWIGVSCVNCSKENHQLEICFIIKTGHQKKNVRILTR